MLGSLTGTARTIGTGRYLPTSSILERLVRDAPGDRVALAWLIRHLGERSFGIVLLVVGICGLLPVISPAIGLLLAIPAFQMMRAHPGPVLPRGIAERRLTTDKLVAVLRRMIPALRYLERFVRPRWSTPFGATKRVVGGFVFLLGIGLMAPLPLTNVPVSLTIVLLAFAYLEEDGVLLVGALVIAVGLFVAGAAAIWGTIAAAGWLAR